MISQIGGRAVVVAPSVTGSKDHPSGLSKVPLRRIRRTIYPPQRIRRLNVEEKDPRRVLDVLAPLSDSRQESVEMMKRRISGVLYMCWMDFHNAISVVVFYVPY